MSQELWNSMIKQLSALARDQATNPTYRTVRYPEDDATFDAIADVLLKAVLRLPADKLHQLAIMNDPSIAHASVASSRELGMHVNKVLSRRSNFNSANEDEITK